MYKFIHARACACMHAMNSWVYKDLTACTFCILKLASLALPPPPPNIEKFPTPILHLCSFGNSSIPLFAHIFTSFVHYPRKCRLHFTSATHILSGLQTRFFFMEANNINPD